MQVYLPSDQVVNVEGHIHDAEELVSQFGMPCEFNSNNKTLNHVF